jgi:hypothetical protein
MPKERRDPDDNGDNYEDDLNLLHQKPIPDGLPARVVVPETAAMLVRVEKLAKAHYLITFHCPADCPRRAQMQQNMVTALDLSGNNGDLRGNDLYVAAMERSCAACKTIDHDINQFCKRPDVCKRPVVGAHLKGFLPI